MRVDIGWRRLGWHSRAAARRTGRNGRGERTHADTFQGIVRIVGGNHSAYLRIAEEIA